MKKNIGILLSGGIGARFGAEQSKQYLMLGGREVIYYSIDALKKAESLDDFIVVVSEAEYATKRLGAEYGVHLVLGGQSRNESFRNALEHIKINFPGCEKIIVCEAARPMITASVIDQYVDLLDSFDFVHTTVKITDSLGSYSEGFANREDYYLIQSPEGYHFEPMYRYFRADSLATAPGQQLPRESKEYRYFDFKNNFKITYPEDLKILEILMKERLEHGGMYPN